MVRRNCWTGALAAAVVVLAVACSPAAAQVKPFQITGEGVAPQGFPGPGEGTGSHWIRGNATYLGRHYGEGSVQTDSADLDPATGLITGEFGSATPFVFVGADGDKLVCHYGRTAFGAAEPGSFELTVVDVLDDGSLVVEALWVAEFVVQTELCTGKFAGVKGSWIMYAWSEPFVLGSDDPLEYGWEGEGELTFPQAGG